MADALCDPLLPQKKKKELLEQFIDSTDRALFFPLDADIFPERKLRIYGFLMEAIKDGKPGPST